LTAQPAEGDSNQSDKRIAGSRDEGKNQQIQRESFIMQFLIAMPSMTLLSDIQRTQQQEKTVRTDVRDATIFYKAQDDHQAYLEKNPYGYCNHAYRFIEWPV
jgi:peptide methionine sulfoxide reductase MsrA